MHIQTSYFNIFTSLETWRHNYKVQYDFRAENLRQNLYLKFDFNFIVGFICDQVHVVFQTGGNVGVESWSLRLIAEAAMSMRASGASAGKGHLGGELVQGTSKNPHQIVWNCLIKFCFVYLYWRKEDEDGPKDDPTGRHSAFHVVATWDSTGLG